MRYGQIRRYDIANGEGIRTSLFVTGCTHHCFNCFNEEYQDFSSGEEWTQAQVDEVLKNLSDKNVAGLTLLGGEPFQNTEELIALVKLAKERFPNKTIWAYSGYVYDELIKDDKRKELLSYCDVLVDGPYMDALRDPALAFRGSSNQRIIDVPETLAKGEVVLHPLHQ